MSKLSFATITAISLLAALPAAAQQANGPHPATPQSSAQPTKPNAQKNGQNQAGENHNMAQSGQGQNKGSAAVNQDEIRQAQDALNGKGFQVGKADGILGPHTVKALKEFQQQQKLQPSGKLDSQTMAALGLSNAQPSTTGQGGGGANPAPQQSPKPGGSTGQLQNQAPPKAQSH